MTRKTAACSNRAKTARLSGPRQDRTGAAAARQMGGTLRTVLYPELGAAQSDTDTVQAHHALLVGAYNKFQQVVWVSLEMYVLYANVCMEIKHCNYKL